MTTIPRHSLVNDADYKQKSSAVNGNFGLSEQSVLNAYQLLLEQGVLFRDKDVMDFRKGTENITSLREVGLNHVEASMPERLHLGT